MPTLAFVLPFGDATIPILAPEHLIVCKVAFDRRKDWLDIHKILFVTAGDLDAHEVPRWVERLLGSEDRWSRRLAKLPPAATSAAARRGSRAH